MLKRIAPIAFIVLCVSVVAAAEDVYVRYGGFSSYEGGVGLGGMSFNISTALDYGSDHVTEIKFCRPQSDFICVTSPHISFSVPSDIEDMSMKWVFEGREFSFQERIFRSIPDGAIRGRSYIWDLAEMGRSDKVFLIQRTAKEDDFEVMTLIYSQESGLIGYTYETPPFYWGQSWLASEYGFGQESLMEFIPDGAWLNADAEPAFLP